MRTTLRIAAIAAIVLAACNQTDGQCWIDDESGGDVGAGGGPIVPGGGGFGDVPPGPQDAADPRLFDCDANNPCEQRCISRFVDAADQCGKVQDEEQRNTCYSAARVAYSACRAACASDPVEQCKKLCDKINEDCIARCPKGDKGCMNDCNQANGKCLKDCEK